MSNGMPRVEMDALRNYTFKRESKYAGDQIAIYEKSHGEDIFEHTHEFFEIVYTYGGEAVHYINDVPYQTKRGDVLIIGIGQRHRIELLGDSTHIADVLFSPMFVDEVLRSVENPIDILALSAFEIYNNKIQKMIPSVQLRGNDILQMESIIKFMAKEYEMKALNYTTTLKSYLVVLLNLMFRNMYDRQSSLAYHHLERITPDILKYIDDNLQEKITLHQLAAKAFYNPSYFSKVFKECYGMTFVDYLNEKRLQKAADLLVNTEFSLVEISAICGFSNSKYFSKLFKQRYAVPPGKYREEHQVNGSDEVSD